MYRCLLSPEALHLSGTGVAGSCKLSDVCSRNQTWVQEQCVLFTPEHLFSPTCSFIEMREQKLVLMCAK